MTIEIKGKEQTLTSKELEELFLSVEWSSGHYPDKIETAMRNYQTVFTECGFYEHCGFKKGEDETPMFITSLWT